MTEPFLFIHFAFILGKAVEPNLLKHESFLLFYYFFYHDAK